MSEFLNEDQFRDWVQSALQALLEPQGNSYLVLRSKNVSDIIVCKNRPVGPLALFIEVKYAKGSSRRIGVGDANGGGFQPEILIRKPDYFERYTQWLVASEAGVAVLVGCDVLRRHAVGSVFAKGKQNNIRPTVFDAENHPFPLDEAPARIAEWLQSV